MFSHLSVSHSVRGGVCLSACWDTPQQQTHFPPRADIPRQDTPLEQTPPRSRHPCSACSEIWATSGSYASYWNAYLLLSAMKLRRLFFYTCLSVILFTGKGSASVRAGIPLPPPSESPPPEETFQGPGRHPRTSRHPHPPTPAQTNTLPWETAAAADGTHPTGECILVLVNFFPTVHEAAPLGFANDKSTPDHISDCYVLCNSRTFGYFSSILFFCP